MGKRERSEELNSEEPTKKRFKGLARTDTIELVPDCEEDKKNVAAQKSSSIIQEIDADLSGHLSQENQKKLERSMSSILSPSSGVQCIHISSEPESPISSHVLEPSNIASLPTEIWIEIFHHLNDTNRWKVAITCHRLLSIFENWVGFNSMRAYHTNKLQSIQSNVIPHTDIRQSSQFRYLEMFSNFPQSLYTADNLLIANRKSITYRGRWKLFRNRDFICVVENHHKEVTEHDTSPHLAMIPLNPESKNSYFLQEFLPLETQKTLFANPKFTELFLSVKWIIHPDKRCEFMVLVDTLGIRNFLQEGRNLSTIQSMFVLMMIKQNALQSFRLTNWRKPFQGINKPALPSPQPNGFKTIKLYEYQLRALAWMKNIEKHVFTKKYSFSTLARIAVLGCYINTNAREAPDFVNAKNWKPYLANDVDSDVFNVSFSTRGGILADEMGLGKTISMISLLLANPRVANADGEYDSRYTNPRALFETKASLVVCPSQLVHQWKQEIEDNTNLSVFSISTITDIKKSTYQNLLDADVVIAPHNLLTQNKQYLKRYQASMPNSRNKSSKNCTLHHVGWHRIILDEGHEVLSECRKDELHYPTGKALWDMYESNFRWYVTGTPLPRGRASFVGLMHFLQISFDSAIELDEESDEYAPFEMLLANTVRKCLFWRNTKDTVSQQVDIPPLSESLELIQLTSIEKALYDASIVIDSPTEQRQICLNPLLSKIIPSQLSVSSLKELPEKMISYYKENIIQILQISIPDRKRTVKHREKQAAYLQQIWEEAKENPPPQPMPNTYSMEYSRFLRKKQEYEQAFIALENEKNKLERDEDSIVTYMSQLACFSRLYPSEENSPCDMCGEIPKQIVRTTCRHIFCATCIPAHIRRYNNCPTCNRYLLMENLRFPLDKKQQAQDADKRDDSDDVLDWKGNLIDRNGSKMAAVLCHVRELVMQTDAKVIVFSQYESILSTLEALLQDLDHELFKDLIVSCKGNIYIRKKQLALFNSEEEGSPRLLFLSLAHSASGTHLAIATHIILLDPVIGTTEEAQATDAQAIARAHRIGQEKPVVAIRFIVENTIDQQDYEKTYGSLSQ